MKHSGRNIRRRLSLIGNRLSRARHFRGYGVHSPFVYSLIRKVFMNKHLFDGVGCELYDKLLDAQLPIKRARELSNTMHHCECSRFSIDEVSGEFVVLTAAYPTEQLATAYEEAKERGAILAIVGPYLNRERQVEVRRLIEQHHSTTIDNRYYILFFNNRLPKQHYRL